MIFSMLLGDGYDIGGCEIFKKLKKIEDSKIKNYLVFLSKPLTKRFYQKLKMDFRKMGFLVVLENSRCQNEKKEQFFWSCLKKISRQNT